MTDWLAAFLLVAGGLFCMIAGVGIVRLRDLYTRMHAATKAGTLGLALVCVAVMLKADDWKNVVEALFVFLFMIATAPIGSHLIGRAAFRSGAPEAPNTGHDPGCEDFRRKRSAGPARAAEPGPS